MAKLRRADREVLLAHAPIRSEKSRMTERRFILRELPGVAEMEDHLKRAEADPSGSWSKLRDGLNEKTDALSVRLFGLAVADTHYPEATGEDDEAWNRSFHRWEDNFACLNPTADGWAVTILILDAAGWDITDGKGKPLAILDYIGRQLVCVAKGLKGRQPGEVSADDEPLFDAAAVEKALAADAVAFKLRKRT